MNGRRTLLVAGLGSLLLRPAAATPQALRAALAAFTGGAPLGDGKVTLEIAALVENGNTVPVSVRVASPMSAADPRLASWRERGQALYGQRVGQLDLACADCHDRHAGQRLAGSVIPQGHPTGYPIYRLEWQGMGSLQRRLRGCLTGVRAEPIAADSDDFTALELFLMQRAAGMLVETPAVRP